MNIILVHGTWVDASSWGKIIPILQNARHNVVAAQLTLTSVADDVSTVKRAIDFIDEPVILVGHSYGGFVITNAAYNDTRVKGLVYLAAFAPEQITINQNYLYISCVFVCSGLYTKKEKGLRRPSAY